MFSNYRVEILSLSHPLEKSFLFLDCFLSFILNVQLSFKKKKKKERGCLLCRNLSNEMEERITSNHVLHPLKSLEFPSVSPLTSWILPSTQDLSGYIDSHFPLHQLELIPPQVILIYPIPGQLNQNLWRRTKYFIF